MEQNRASQEPPREPPHPLASTFAPGNVKFSVTFVPFKPDTFYNVFAAWAQHCDKGRQIVFFKHTGVKILHIGIGECGKNETRFGCLSYPCGHRPRSLRWDWKCNADWGRKKCDNAESVLFFLSFLFLFLLLGVFWIYNRDLYIILVVFCLFLWW